MYSLLLIHYIAYVEMRVRVYVCVPNRCSA